MLFRLSPNPVLVALILDRLPAEVWASTSTTFIDPAMGSGQFVTEIERRLRAHGHSDDNIRSRVFGLESNQMDVNIAVNMNGLVGTYRKDANYSAFLSGELKRLLGKDYPMKFDVVIGNPPYQGEDQANAKLWKDFLVNASQTVTEDGFIGFVVPSTWAKPVEGKVLASNATINDLMFNHKILDVSFDGSKFFPTVGIDISWFVLQKTRVQQPNVFVRSAPFGEILKKVNSNGQLVQLRSANETAYKPHAGRKVDESKPKFEVLYHRPGQYTNIDDPVRKLKKLVFPRRFGYDALADCEGKYALSESCAFLEHQNPAAALTWYKSKIVRALMKKLSFTPQTDFGLLKSIKAPNLNKTWTDAALYKHFGLTQEEINLIERTVK